MEWRTTQFISELASQNEFGAWTLVNDHFYPMLFNRARRLGLSESDSEDVAQQALLTCFKKCREFDTARGHLHSWFLGIAKIEILTIRRQRDRRRLDIYNGLNTMFWDLVEDEKAAERTWDTLGHWERLTYCLEGARREFSVRDYKVFDMFALQEKSAEYVAEKLNISKNNVRLISWRIRCRMKEIARQFDGTS